MTRIANRPTTTDTPSPHDEADHLRCAALIVRVLDDGEPHRWTAVIDDARDLTDGDRRAAGDLAWRTLTGLLSWLRVEWTGKPGARHLRRLADPEDATRRPCPTCGADPGRECVAIGTDRPRRWPHAHRELPWGVEDPADA